ncbi:trehalase family glycosidase [Paraflavisolibacter sp. H34]|uniref:trehalase family glycosidase n=1 Tax=Huijunlia imazamoxiresistens TaxID=3127457 RepID=UPI003019F0D3
MYPEATSLYFPERDLGELFPRVQLEKIFPDSKTFVDCLPVRPPAEIVAAYEREKNAPDFSLPAFVAAHFRLPPGLPQLEPGPRRGMMDHIRAHWAYLTREALPTHSCSTLVPLPYPYVVPGGRFREFFYWDSYFTLIGLLESGADALALGLLRNCAYLVNRFGFIPNGNRTYFLSRSQPPFFAAMLQAYAQKHGLPSVLEFLPPLEQEYRYWTGEAAAVTAGQPVAGKSVRLEGIVLNRYDGGEVALPRAEAYDKEWRAASVLPEADRKAFYRNQRAVCESGWDFSSRWLADGRNRATVRCEQMVPVCLNSLLYATEQQLAQLHDFMGHKEKSDRYTALAAARREGVHRYCWQEARGLFTDFDFVKGTPNEVLSLATVYPLFFGLASPQQAAAIAPILGEKFLYPGGLVTTLTPSGEQWDYPNGWAPLQWLAVMGLDRYGYHELARTIAQRWLELNEEVFRREGKLMEKYNVVNLALPGGGGSYANQDGFGWTNGVALALHAWLGGKND